MPEVKIRKCICSLKEVYSGLNICNLVRKNYSCLLYKEKTLKCHSSLTGAIKFSFEFKITT